MGRRQRNWGALAPLCLLLLLFFLLTLGASYKPVVVVHGLFDSPSDFSHLLRFINQTHPGTNVTVVDLFDHSQSLKPLWVQVEGFRRVISPIMQNAADGVHLICYSQAEATRHRALDSALEGHGSRRHQVPELTPPAKLTSADSGNTSRTRSVLEPSHPREPVLDPALL
ncbi:tRNA dimethylallyltransferase [Platysternon megacephalum]|uniref:tRNA dimethylallyltransferase n=1 Tax=Platysternon megacephalum TaxID=55544 RepID=A0A4D9DHC9_9SAUR|nr:tRNA dimethylallyltransferase [Platysternon megacephalum]